LIDVKTSILKPLGSINFISRNYAKYPRLGQRPRNSHKLCSNPPGSFPAKIVKPQIYSQLKNQSVKSNPNLQPISLPPPTLVFFFQHLYKNTEKYCNIPPDHKIGLYHYLKRFNTYIHINAY